MAFYPTIKDYLYDQFVLPLKKAIDENNEEEIDELIDFFCDKYIELNAFAKGHEKYVEEKYNEKPKDMPPIMEYVKKYVEPYFVRKSWDECITVYSQKPTKESESKKCDC